MWIDTAGLLRCRTEAQCYMLAPVHTSWITHYSMAKRRLSEQQKRRIGQRQRQERARAGGEPDNRQAIRNGLVIARFGRLALVAEPPFHSESPLIRCHLRSAARDAAAGDDVAWQEGESGAAVITAVMPRRTALQRPDARQHMRTIAANVDLVLIVIAPFPEPHRGLLDRYLVVAENLRMTPVIVVNKCDLDAARDPAITDITRDYQALGYEVISVSAGSGAALDTLGARIATHTCVLVGQSGVGKSSLLNRLVPDAATAVGDLSEGAAKGTHTTTTSRLFFLEGGGRLVDSPGIREFGVAHLSADEIAWGMVEIRPLLGRCRFRNCRHLEEPGCALKEAAESGIISPERMTSFRHMTDTLESRNTAQ